MQERLNEVYIGNLDLFVKRYGNYITNSRVKRLKQAIASANTLEDLLQVLSPVTENSCRFFSNPAVNRNLAAWRTEIEHRLALRLIAQQALSTIKVTPENASLVALLRKVIGIPQCLLHSRAHSLLNSLCSNTLANTINIIVSLPVASPLYEARAGSFSSSQPYDELHAIGLQLLQNLAACEALPKDVFDSANALLQDVNYIYKDAFAKEELEVEDAASCKCILL